MDGWTGRVRRMMDGWWMVGGWRIDGRLNAEME